MKRTSRSIISLTTFLALALSTPPATAEVVDRIVLRVNDRIATSLDYRDRLADRRRAILGSEADQKSREEALAEAGQRVFHDLYEELLLLSRADQLGITATEADIDEVILDRRERMGLTSEEAFDRALAASDLSREALREQILTTLLIQQVMAQEVQSRIEVEEEDLRRYYRQHSELFETPARRRLREVVLLEEGWEEAEAEAVGREILREIEAGASLDDVAAKWGEEGKVTGLIDLGWVEAGDLDPRLEEAIWDREEGIVEEAIPARGGLHLVEIVERRSAGVRPFDEVREEVDRRVRQDSLKTVYPEFLKELEDAAYVVMHLPPEAEGFEGLPYEVEDEFDLREVVSQ